MNESWTGVNVDLAKDCVSAVNEAVRSVRGDDDNAAGFHFTGLIPDRDGGAAFKRERDLDVWMRVQRRALAGFCVDNVGGERRALRFADEFIRHPDKREFLKIKKRHNKTDA